MRFLSNVFTGIKGPLAFADAKIFAFDPSSPDFYDENSPISSAIGSSYSEISGLSVPRNIRPPYIMTIGGVAVDLNTGKALVIPKPVTIIIADMLANNCPSVRHR